MAAGQAQRFVRRNRVDERWAVAIAVAAGVLAAAAGAAPTGSMVVDSLLVAVSVAAVVWAAASAPWWAVASAAGVAAVVAFDPVVAAVAAVAFLAGLVVGVRRQDAAEVRAVVAAVAMNALIRSDLEGFHGLSAIVGLTVGVALLWLGLRRRPASVRRPGFVAVGLVAVVAAVAVVGVAASAWTSRSDLSSGTRTARAAINAVNDGDYERAAALFDDAARSFESVDSRLSGPLTVPATWMPAVAQNLKAGTDLAAAASVASDQAAVALRQVDADSLSVQGGRIDVEAIRAVEDPLVQVGDALTELRSAVDGVESPWLLDPIRVELDELIAEFDENEPRLDNAVEAVRLAPALLGAEETRRYLVMFTSPAEARGATGFMGNYAVVEASDGQLAVTDFGRRSDLERRVRWQGPVTCAECDDELVDRYGRFSIAVGPERAFDVRGWSNLTMPAHFPYVGEAAASVFSQTEGDDIDGVIAVDPYVIEALMRYTGRIALPELGTNVRPRQAAEFILNDQYLLSQADDGSGDIDNAERIDALDTLGTEVIRRLLEGSLPEPSVIAKDLGPLVEEGRLLAWAADPAEQALFDRIGMSGALPELGADGGFAVSVANGGQNKVDYFLEREVDVDVVTDPETGARALVADVALTNNAPTSGYPQYVIGNAFGLPDGTSRPLVTFYGPDGLQVITRNGEPFDVDTHAEAGWTGYSSYDVIAPGETVEYSLTFALGSADDEFDDPVLWTQPLTRADL